MLAISVSKRKPKAKLSTANRNDEEYMMSEKNEVADKEVYLRSLAPLIDPYDEVKRSIGSRASSATKMSRKKAGSSLHTANNSGGFAGGVTDFYEKSYNRDALRSQ